MGLIFIDSSKQAIFDPGYPLFQNDAFDFSVGFWFKLSSEENGKSKNIFYNQNYDEIPFMKVFIIFIFFVKK